MTGARGRVDRRPGPEPAAGQLAVQVNVGVLGVPVDEPRNPTSRRLD
ncbi:hypothetical protein ACLQ3D_16215 [Micromonospora vinacea]